MNSHHHSHRLMPLPLFGPLSGFTYVVFSGCFWASILITLFGGPGPVMKSRKDLLTHILLVLLFALGSVLSHKSVGIGVCELLIFPFRMIGVTLFNYG